MTQALAFGAENMALPGSAFLVAAALVLVALAVVYFKVLRQPVTAEQASLLASRTVFRRRVGRTAKIVQIIVADHSLAARVLNRLKLEAAPAIQLAAIGNGILDRRELQKVVLAFARTVKHQQHEPNRLQRVSPLAAFAVRRRPLKAICHYSAPLAMVLMRALENRCAPASIGRPGHRPPGFHGPTDRL